MVYVAGIGTVELKVQALRETGSPIRTLVLKNVLHVLDAICNRFAFTNITSSTEAKIDATHPKDLMRRASLFGVVNHSKEWLAGWYCLENLGASHIQATIFNRSMFTLRMKI